MTDLEKTLTDDELAWLFSTEQRAYPGPLPTLLVNDPVDIARAAQRGVRSMVLRGLVNTSSPAASDLPHDLLGRLPWSVCVWAYTAENDGTPVTFDRSTALMPASDGWIADDLNGRGVHLFRGLTRADAEKWLGDLAVAAAEADADDHVNLGISVTSPGSLTSWVVSSGAGKVTRQVRDPQTGEIQARSKTTMGDLVAEVFAAAAAPSS